MINTKKQKTFIVLIVLLVLISLFTPIPSYLSEDAICLAGQNCPKKGWYLNGSFWNYFTYRIRNVGARSERSIPLPVPFSSYNPETFCMTDNDCGINICGCRAMRKEYIRPKDNLCARFCEGKVRCINNQCVLSR